MQQTGCNGLGGWINMALDPKILLDKIKNLKTKVQAINFGDVFVAGLNTGNALMQQRIFNQNLDTEGNNFGTYIGAKKNLTDRQKRRLLGSTRSRTDLTRIKRNLEAALTPYQRKRANKGRQVVKKDLEFEGTLRNSIEVQIINERAAALMFNNDQSVLVAKGQENQITNIRNGLPGYVTGDGIMIFALNEDEREGTHEQVRLLVNQLIHK